MAHPSFRTEIGHSKVPDDASRIVQQKHYFYLSELQNLAQELPPKYQQRLSYDLLTSLASSLLDGTVLDIVHGLKELQQMKERHLFEKHMKLINAHRDMRQDLQKKHKEALATEMQVHPQLVDVLRKKQDKEREEMEKRQEEEEMRADMKVIMELDQVVSDQQVTLEKAGVPGFFVTNNPNEIRLQMYLLDFIMKMKNAVAPT